MPKPAPPFKDGLLFQSIKLFLESLRSYHRYSVAGLDHIPDQGPALIAVHHSLATYDSLLLGLEIYLRKNRRAIGLVDRRIFQTPGLAQIFDAIQGEVGTPEVGMRILGDGNLLMLSPGGMRESLRPSSQRFQIDWQNRLGFARLAIRAQVPVILAACPAADCIYSVYSNPITMAIYHRFKWPLPLARGIGPTLFPRPVKLTHFIRKPIHPPRLKKGADPTEDTVKEFHRKLTGEMELLLRKK